MEEKLEQMIKDIYEVVEDLQAKEADLLLENDDQIRELEKMKFMYFRKGFLACLMQK